MWRSAQLLRSGFHRVCLTGATTVLLPAALSAQPPTGGSTSQSLAPVPSCSPAALALTVRIVDSASGAVLGADDAVVTVRRVSTGDQLPDAEEAPFMPGRWVLFTNTTLSDVGPEGETLLVQIARPGRASVTREIRLIMDAAGCRPALAEALDEIKA